MATRTGSDGEPSTVMDTRLWGGLRDFVDLSMIYAKLPIEEFFRLRLVCKEWNRLASDRVFLEQSFRDPIPEPYFIVDSRKMGHRLLTHDPSSHRWSWNRLPPAKCAVAGLLCDYSEGAPSNRVFNLHTRAFHTLPPPPDPGADADFEEPLGGMVGLTVDTSVRPYTFKIFHGEVEIGTRIYDSRRGSWAQKPSTHEYANVALDYEAHQKPLCFDCNGVLYFRVWEVTTTVTIHTYNLEKDEWQCAEPRLPDEMWTFCDVGVWQDRLFYLRSWSEASAIEAVEQTVGAGHETEGDWTVVGGMPEDLRVWMLVGKEGNLGEFGEQVEMQSVFCGERVLVYNCVGVEDVTERAVLYNLDRKTWEKLELPASSRCVVSLKSSQLPAESEVDPEVESEVEPDAEPK